MDVELTTPRLRLSPMAWEDVPAYLEVDADPEVMRFITGGLPSTRADVERRLAAAGSYTWTARSIADGRFVGWFSLRSSADGEAELGYRLRRDAWGQGFATEGARRLVDHGFTDLGLERIWAQTMTVNERSRRVMERLGLVFVRTFFEEWEGDEIPGGELGDVEYELLRSDWPGAA